jgi:hypothetical protein
MCPGLPTTWRDEGCEGAIPAFALLPVNRRPRPIGSASGQPVAGHLAVVIHGIGLLCEGGPVFQAIGVDDGAGSPKGSRQWRRYKQC